jgi:hypothetical protein
MYDLNDSAGDVLQQFESIPFFITFAEIRLDTGS